MERKCPDIPLSSHPALITSVYRILCTVPTHQLGLIYAGRLLTGLGVGGISATSGTYIAELSPPAIRGRLTGLYAKKPLVFIFHKLLELIVL